MVVFKVVSGTGEAGIYEPAIMSVMDDKRVTYALGKTTTPPKGWGPLVAFRTLIAAVTFRHRSNHIILKGDGTTSPHAYLWFREGGKKVSHFVVPPTTVFLDSFTPTEVVTSTKAPRKA